VSRYVPATKHLLDPELQAMVDGPTIPELTDEAVGNLRQMMATQAPELGDPATHGLTRGEIQVPLDGETSVRCLLYKPTTASQDLRPGYVHIHGGGYLFGTPDGSDASNLQVAGRLGAVVISVDYRLAPEHPIPAPLDDCYAALAWLHENAAELGVDRQRIGIGGESAGGGLAAALALKARDAGKYAICWQQLTYPMLDDRTGSPEQPGDPLVGEFVWTRHSNQYGWDSYLGAAPRAAPQVPARAESLADLPPTWMFTATLDLFRDENIDYAQRLMQAGVPCELVVYPGACHGFQGVVTAEVSKRFNTDFLAALARGLGCG
jgi:acetyl esterase/lipase